MATRRHRRRTAALIAAALAISLTPLGSGSPAGAQAQPAFPDAHHCTVGATPPSNSQGRERITVTATVRCYTDRSQVTRGEVNAIGIRIQLLTENGAPVAIKDERTTVATDQWTTSLTFPDLTGTDVAVCSSGPHYAEVTGSAEFKSGMPTFDEFTVTTPIRNVTCEARFPPPEPPPLPPIPEIPPPTPTPTPTPEPTPPYIPPLPRPPGCRQACLPGPGPN